MIGIYIRTLKVVMIMRDYLNKEGCMHISKEAQSDLPTATLDFTECYKPKYITLLSNLFMIYASKELKDKEWMPLKDELAEEVEQLCSWLYNENYTNLKLIRAATNVDTSTL